MTTDAERLNWMDAMRDGVALVHDDFESWAVMRDGEQTCAPAPTTPGWYTCFSTLPGFEDEILWRPTIREAIDAAMEARDDH